MGPEGRDGHSAKLLLGLAAASMPGWLAKFLSGERNFGRDIPILDPTVLVIRQLRLP